MSPVRVQPLELPEPPVERPEKRFANAQARAALMGATLHRIDDDRGEPAYVITKWALTRQLAAMADVEAWLDRLEGKAGST